MHYIVEQQVVLLTVAQREFLKRQPAGISGTIRILVDDAIVRAGRQKNPTKEQLREELDELRRQAELKEVALRDEVSARLEAEARAAEAIQALKTGEQLELEAHDRWNTYRDAHPNELRGLNLQQLKDLKARVTGAPPSPPSPGAPPASGEGGQGVSDASDERTGVD